MTLTIPDKNKAFASLIAKAVGYSLEHPGESTVAVDKEGKRAILRWARDAKETLEFSRAQLRAAHHLLVAIGDPTGVLFEIFRIKREDLIRFRKDGRRDATCTVSLRDAAEVLEMVMPLQVTARQVEDAWGRVSR